MDLFGPVRTCRTFWTGWTVGYWDVRVSILDCILNLKRFALFSYSGFPIGVGNDTEGGGKSE